MIVLGWIRGSRFTGYALQDTSHLQLIEGGGISTVSTSKSHQNTIWISHRDC